VLAVQTRQPPWRLLAHMNKQHSRGPCFNGVEAPIRSPAPLRLLLLLLLPGCGLAACCFNYGLPHLAAAAAAVRGGGGGTRRAKAADAAEQVLEQQRSAAVCGLRSDSLVQLVWFY